MKFDELASDAAFCRLCQTARLAGRGFDIDARKQSPLRFGKEVELLHGHRASRGHRVPLGDAGHDGCEVSAAFNDAIRVDPAIEEPVSVLGVGPVLLIAGARPAIGLGSSPVKPRQRNGLAREFLWGQEARCTGVGQRNGSNWTVVRDGRRTEPLRQDDFGQQIFEVVALAAAESATEGTSQALHLRRLRVRGEQLALEVRVSLGGRLNYGAPHDRWPPEFHGGRGEARIGDDLFREPLETVVGIGRFMAIEPGRTHVAVPSVAFPVRVHRHRDFGNPIRPILVPFESVGPGNHFDLVAAPFRGIHLQPHGAVRRPSVPECEVAALAAWVVANVAARSPMSNRCDRCPRTPPLPRFFHQYQ